MGPFPGARGARAFLITGTQTGGWPCIGLDGLSLVRRYEIEANRVVSEGAVAPSSEAMTHGAVYDLSPRIRCVLHVHAPVLWARAAELGLPITPPEVAYGTVAMAQAVSRVARASVDGDHGVFSMGGHPDGIIAWGTSVDAAGSALVAAVAAASARVYADRHALCSGPLGRP
ncbi:MAG: class II aldolase/adducin family protein [Myxococcales bacterium]|nr:class II aldolase/adducin family protein [Myxococcales bacterium]